MPFLWHFCRRWNMMETMEDILEATETRLFNRMMWNSVKGFLKGALIGIVIGAAIGAAIFGLGVIPASILPETLLGVTGGSIAMAGAIIGASICLLPAGRIGQVAGVQSTRDARRYLLAHEATRHDTVIPPETDPLNDVSEVVTEKTQVPVRPAYRDRILSDTTDMVTSPLPPRS
jgi:uncharacterized membrane protein